MVPQSRNKSLLLLTDVYKRSIWQSVFAWLDTCSFNLSSVVRNSNCLIVEGWHLEGLTFWPLMVLHYYMADGFSFGYISNVSMLKYTWVNVGNHLWVQEIAKSVPISTNLLSCSDNSWVAKGIQDSTKKLESGIRISAHLSARIHFSCKRRKLHERLRIYGS